MSAIHDQVAAAIQASITGAHDIEVSGEGGHFNIALAAPAFEGLSTLERHRLVLNAIKELMAGHNAPVHAVDSIRTRTS